MSCTAKQLNRCQLIQNSYKSILLYFGETDISADTITLKIFDGFNRIEKQTIVGQIDSENRVYFPEFTLAKGDYAYEVNWEAQTHSNLVIFGKYKVTDKANDCGCGDNSDVVTVSVDNGDTIVEVQYSEVILNVGIGGDVDLSSYSKKDGSNITDVVNWQTALDIYTATEAQSKNNAQDSAISANTSAIETKVDKIEGFGLSEENFSQEEKTKLAGIEENKFRGKFPSFEALELQFGFVGAYAYVGGQGVDDQSYLWDDDDEKWVLNSSQATAETPASIKTKYESNADTNAFTNAFKTKLTNLFNYVLQAATSAVLGGVYFKNTFDKNSVNPDIVSPKTLYDFLSDPGEYVTTTQTVDLGTLSVGYVKTSDGLVDASLTAWRSSDYIPCSSNQVYFYGGYAYSSVDATNAVFAYNSAKVYLGIVLLDTTSAVALTDQQFTIPNNPNIAYLRAVYRNNGGDVKVLKRQITIPSPDAKRIVPVTDVWDRNDKSKALSGYAAMQYPLNKSWGCIGHSIWDRDETQNVGFQTLIKRRIIFSSYSKFTYPGNSLTGNTLTDSNSILATAKTSTWIARDIYTLDTITNDFKLNRSIGTTADFLSSTPPINTYYGALRILHNKLYALNPQYRLVCASALQRDNEGYTSYSTNTAGHTLDDYTTALLWVRHRLAWGFVDQRNDSGITMENIMQFSLDGLHLTDLGYERCYMPWVQEIKKIG